MLWLVPMCFFFLLCEWWYHILLPNLFCDASLTLVHVSNTCAHSPHNLTILFCVTEASNIDICHIYIKTTCDAALICCDKWLLKILNKKHQSKGWADVTEFNEHLDNIETFFVVFLVSLCLLMTWEWGSPAPNFSCYCWNSCLKALVAA
jgi:hypothetical protein